MRKQSLRALIAVMTMLMAASAEAAFCDGQVVTGVNVDGSGGLLLSFESLGSNMTVCSLNADWGKWTVAACRALLTEATAAMLAGKRVAVWFASKPNCEANPNWSVVGNDLYHFKICTGAQCGG